MKRQPALRQIITGLGANLGLAVFFAISMFTLSEPQGATYTTYRLDTDKSGIHVRVSAEGFASPLAHNHVISATGIMEGELRRKGHEFISAEGHVTLPAAQLAADEPASRKRHGLDPISPRDRKKIQRTMRAAGQLDVGRFPEIRFTLSNVTALSPTSCRLKGVLEIHGRTDEVETVVEAVDEANNLRVTGSFQILQSRFGIKPYSALWGTLRNKDLVEIQFDLFWVVSR